MNDFPNTFIFKRQLVISCLLIFVSLFLLLIFISSIWGNKVQAQPKTSTASSQGVDSESPNLITSGMFIAVDEFGQAMNSTAVAINNGVQSVASATAEGGRIVTHRAVTNFALVFRTTGTGLAVAGRAVAGSAVFVFRLPGKGIHLVSKISLVSTVIRPADHAQVPIIDPDSPELVAAIAALPPTKDNGQQPVPNSNIGPAWPIHGVITTEFGVAHWPYQPTHTGLDISDAKAPGITPVRPFRPGKVAEVVHSNSGLGNHVVVDHGNGVTSVYAHLASTSVQVGQAVDLATILGLEGTTGLSTGTHLHFEIRVNGQAANPHQFISGQP